MSRLIAITGGNGFIGSHLDERHMALGDRIRVLSRTNRRRINRTANVRTKAEDDQLVTARIAAGGFSYRFSRLSIVFGAKMPNNPLRQFVHAINRSLPFFIGSPGAILPYVAAEDVVQGLWLCGTRSESRNQTYNLSENLSVESVVHVIVQSLGCRSPKVRVPESIARMVAALGQVIPGFPLTKSRVDALTSRARYDSSRFRSELGFRPALPIGQRIDNFVKHYQAGNG